LKEEYGFDVKAAVAELDQWSIRETGRLSKIEVESRIFKFVDTTRALLNNEPELGGTPMNWNWKCSKSSSIYLVVCKPDPFCASTCIF
jgi:hypothetical protein